MTQPVPQKSLERFPILVGCGFGLEKIVCRELRALGMEGQVVSPGFVTTDASAREVCLANMWLRCADRVQILLAEGKAGDFDQLFQLVTEADWARWLPEDAKIDVSAHSVRSALVSIPAVQRATKRAIVNRMSEEYARESLPESGTQYRVHTAIVSDQAWITIDTTGPSLHRRGYREKYQRDDLKESLAAAIILLTGWTRDQPLLDPCCACGTLILEAALIGCQIAPGRNRSFAAEAWPNFAEQDWEVIRRAADEQQLDDLSPRIVGVDTDRRKLQRARQEAERCGVEDSVHFQPNRMERVSSSRRSGWLVTSPPWSTQGPDAKAVLEGLPLVLKDLPDWSHAILSDNDRLETVFGRKADKRRKLYNERRKCTLFTFEPKRVGGRIEPAFGSLTEKANEQAELFARRLLKRAKHLRRWPSRQEIYCYRLYERDIPEIPLVVDRYENNLHITEYERPHDRDPAQHAAWLELMANTAAKTLEIPYKQTFLKSRQRQKGNLQHGRVGQEQHEVTVREGGLKFIVNLSDYIDTGLFLDHRTTRCMFRDEALKKRVLNLFAYTGAFSVYAADGAAHEVTTVDLSPTYIAWARKNMELNELTSEHTKFETSDAMQFVSNQPVEPLWDLAIIDPPTFSNSKKTKRDWEVQTGHVDLLNQVLDRMSDHGVIYFSNNFRGFKFGEEHIQAAKIHEISKQTVPPDFRNRRIHRCWRIEK